ncbi:AHH domain-containing protein [Capnocytophaga stomatis]|uniref:AHH domain-containing protein n=1 Tax=Capnocytophaga stomatis TaxID=1848904 RepID=A0ABW8QCI8_9FLAO
MKPIKPLYVFLLFWVSFSLKAQQYPVDVQLVVTPPYEQSLRDYWASFEPKIQVYLLLKDLNSPVRNVALRFSLENVQGQPLAQTPDFLQPFQTQLTSGVRKSLSNIELKALFAFENLQGVSENFYNDLLPEGAYFFCLTAYDVATQMPLSAKARTLVQIRRYTPPLPTLPAKGEIISKKNQFQHLVFQWMLRDPAPFTQYEFTLKEVWDNSLSPDEAFISGRLVYQGKIPSNTILYGPDKPILLENRRYVWKVRAFTQNPNNPNQRQSFFHNNGESQAFYFDYVSHCEAPKFLTATTKDNTANIRWSSGGGEPPRANTHSGENGGLYKILYREKGKNWKSQMSNHPQATLAGLKRGRNYIYKVGIACGLGKAMGNTFGEQTYLYSTEQEFVTPHKANDSTSVQCGVKPEIRIKNREPLQEVLGVNETFTAGDFPVTIIRATGSNGVFSGEGYVQVPYLLDTKIKVKFDGIKINYERQLFEGKLVTTYDKTEKNVQFIQEGIGEVFGDAGAKTNKIDFEIAEIKKDENGRVVVIGKPDEKTGIAPQVVLPAGSDYQLSDASGKVWTLDEQGEVTSVGEKADTQLAQNQNKNNLPKGQPKSENFEIKWDFSPSEFAFDASGEIPYKALVKGKNDVFQVVIKQKDTLRYSFHFQTDKGLKVDSEKAKEGVFEISRKGLFDFADEELWVVAKNTKTEKEEVIGKCILVHLSEKEVNVTLIPVAENLPIDTEKIKTIYAKVGVKLTISTDKLFPITETIDTKNAFGDLSTYSPEQQDIITRYKSERAVKSDTYYVFVGKQEGSQAGYMRLGGQFGFVLDANERTIAHELGHGIFKLEHSFKGKGDTGNPHRLMDYAGGENFAHSDWKQINDPKLKIYAFQGQSEGEFGGKIWLTPDWRPFSFNKSHTTSIDRKELTKIPQGTLPAIKYDEEPYFAEFSAQGKFVGYQTVQGSTLNIYYQTVTDKTEIYLYRAGSICGSDRYYVTSWGYIKDKRGKEIDFENNGGNIKYAGTVVCDELKKGNCSEFALITAGHISEIAKYQKQLNSDLKNAVTKIAKSRQTEIQPLGTYNHIVNSVVSNESASQLYELEEKLHLLSHYTDVDVVVTFLQLESNKYIEEHIVSDLAQNAVRELPTNNRKVVYVVIASSNYESIFKEGTINQKTCYSIAYAQSHNDVVRVKQQGKSVFETIIGLYADIEKPVIFNKFYQYADGSVQNYIYKSKTNQRGYPFIKHLEFYQSKTLSSRSVFYPTSPSISDDKPLEEIMEQVRQARADAELALQKETSQNGLANKELWKTLSINDLGKFREVFMDYGQNGTPDYPRYLWQNSVNTWSWGNKVTIALGQSSLPSEALYDFKKMTLLDDAVYSMLDIFGIIPGVDTFTDPIGAAYALARSDVENAIIYSASAVTPLVGIAYVRGGAKALSKAEPAVALVAKKADNADGFELVYKSVNDIQANEFYVATSIDGKQSQAFLEQTKKYLDKDAIKKQVDKLAKAKNIAKVLNTAQELVDDIVANRSTIRKNIIELAESKAYAQKYFDKFVKQGDFDDWFKNTFAKYESNTLNFEAHHIIPIDVLKTNSDLKQLLFDLKKADPNFNFDFNGIENGMMIQKKSLKLDVNGHASHNDYNREIGKKISEIINNVNGDNELAFKQIQRLIKNTKNKLEQEVLLGTKNVNDIINF